MSFPYYLSLHYSFLTLCRMAFSGLLTDETNLEAPPPISKIRYTYPTMVKLGKVITYPKNYLT